MSEKDTKNFPNLWQMKMLEISPAVYEFQKTMERITEPLVRFGQILESLRVPTIKFIETEFLPFADMFKKLAVSFELTRRLNESGWLPHYSTPFDLVSGEIEEIREALAGYYKDNWVFVRSEIEKKIADFDLDDESRSVFIEALNAHEAGSYRAVSRLIFPEIERLSRIEFEVDNHFKPLSSQRDLRELAGKLPIRGGLEAAALFEKLYDHIYMEVKSPEALEAVQKDGVPNRHACLHGLVSYGTMQNSINSIFLIEYVFWVFDYAKSLQRAQNDNAVSVPASASGDLW